MTIIIWSDYCRNSNCSIDERRSVFGKNQGVEGAYTLRRKPDRPVTFKQD